MDKVAKKKILVVDDDNNLNSVLVEKLTFSGFDAVGAHDGEEGLKKALEIHPDIILLDIMMPKMGGMEVLDHLRKDAWGKTAKVIMLTALEDVNLVAQAMEKGSYKYIEKVQHSLGDIVKQVEAEIARDNSAK